MGKKKAFLVKKEAKRFRLIPSSGPVQEEGEKFQPTQEHIEEQHKYGIYYDDDYDYTQHLRDVKEGFALHSMDPEDEEEERVIIKAPKRPPMPLMFGEGAAAPSKPVTEAFDEEIDRLLEGDLEGADGDLDDDFIAMAGGAAVREQLIRHRAPRGQMADSDAEGSEDDEEYDSYDDDFEDYEEGEGENEGDEVHRDGPQREIDDAFNKLMEADYHEDQMGELDGDDQEMGGYLEPDDGRLKRLAKEKPGKPEYDEMEAKEYVRQRMALIASGAIKEDETEIVEVDESCRKRMKWDCESFASQYSNIYNHPTLIKDPTARLSRRALKHLDREAAKNDAALAEDVEMSDEDMEDDSSQCTTMSTMRPKGETTEERKLRKQAVKEAKRFRREEKKQNKTAFAEEFRKVAKARVGQIKAKPIL